MAATNGKFAIGDFRYFADNYAANENSVLRIKWVTANLLNV